MQLTLYTDYSLRVLLYLSRMPQASSTITEIASFYQISRNHLTKVVHRLAQLGFVESVRGKGGGIKLAQAPQEIKIGAVVRLTEPHFCMVECFNQQTNQCVITGMCHLKGVLSQATEAYLQILDNYTLQDGGDDLLTQRIAQTSLKVS